MKKVIWTLALLSFIGLVYACETPTNGMSITLSTTLCKDTYNFADGITIDNSDIIIDCNGSTLIGNGSQAGINLDSQSNVFIKNCNVNNYAYGIILSASSGSNISNSNVSTNTITGIQLDSCSNCKIYNTTSSFNSESGVYLVGGSNNEFSNVSLISNMYGVHFEQTQNNQLFDLFISSSSTSGIYFHDSVINALLNGITFNSNNVNIQSDSPLNLTVFVGGTLFPFTDITTLVDFTSSVHTEAGMISIDAATSPFLNISTNVSLTLPVGKVCPATIKYLDSYTTNLADVLAGVACTDLSPTPCRNIQCSGSTVTFEVDHFDSYGAEGSNPSSGAVPEFNLATILLVMIATLFGISIIRTK